MVGKIHETKQSFVLFIFYGILSCETFKKFNCEECLIVLNRIS